MDGFRYDTKVRENVSLGCFEAIGITKDRFGKIVDRQKVLKGTKKEAKELAILYGLTGSFSGEIDEKSV